MDFAVKNLEKQNAHLRRVVGSTSAVEKKFIYIFSSTTSRTGTPSSARWLGYRPWAFVHVPETTYPTPTH
jgi:hypothetical protein